MKLRRLISALIVFTLVMTSMISVNAAFTGSEAASWVYTSYTTDGKVAVNASVVNGAEGDWVSYIIYGDNDETAEDVTEGNIIHIDQATVGGDGTATFPVVSFTESEIKNRHVKITTSNDTALVPYVDGYVGHETQTWYHANSLSTIGEKAISRNFRWQAGANYADGLKSFKVTGYDKSDLTTPIVSVERTWAGTDSVPMTADYLVFDVVPDDGYYITSFGFTRQNSGHNGKSKQALTKSYTLEGNRVAVDVTETDTDLWSGANGGAGDWYRYNATTAAVSTDSPVYMTVDANPIYSKVGDWEAVTFLTTKNNISGTAGIDIVVYPVGYETGDTATYTFTDLDIITEGNNCAIQLVAQNDVNVEYFDADNYVMEAKPYYYVGNAKTYLVDSAATGYYTVNRADASGSFNK